MERENRQDKQVKYVVCLTVVSHTENNKCKKDRYCQGSYNFWLDIQYKDMFGETMWRKWDRAPFRYMRNLYKQEEQHMPKSWGRTIPDMFYEFTKKSHCHRREASEGEMIEDAVPKYGNQTMRG